MSRSHHTEQQAIHLADREKARAHAIRLARQSNFFPDVSGLGRAPAE